jgi:nitrogen regulatory protein PII
MADTVRAKLITIIASAELQDQLEENLRSLGASGYNSIRIDGHGQTRPRIRGLFEMGNVRIETIVRPVAAEAILAHFAQQARGTDLIAFSQDIDAVPSSRFA